VRIEFDPAKRQLTLDVRGLDMAEAAAVFEGKTITVEDQRKDCGETRFFTVGRLPGRLVALIWTPRGDVRRIISMRKANERERAACGGRT
jgi:hypothetical protein